MKILFICLEGYPRGGACAVLLNKLLRQKSLNSLGEIHVLAVKSDLNEADMELHGKVNIHRFFSMSFLETRAIVKYLLKYPVYSVYTLTESIWRRFTSKLGCDISFLRHALISEVRSALEHIRDEKFDVIIPISGYYEASYAALRYAQKYRIPMILYQVDPCTTNRLYPLRSYQRRLKLEQDIYQYCAHGITTPISKREMSSIFREEYMKKMLPVMFPNVEPVHKNGSDKVTFKNQIQCVFTGRIYRGARDPRFTISLFSRLHTNNIKLKLVGIDIKGLFNYIDASILPSSIECCGSLPFEEAQAAIEDADILVNIGNLILNQLPSKLFEYISSGKPIVNVCTSHECPSIPYMERYQLAINLFACDENLEEQAAMLEHFIFENAGKRLAPEQILREFPECTAAYCAKVIADTIKDVTK